MNPQIITEDNDKKLLEKSAERIKDLRKGLKLTQEQFAERINSSPQHISYIENARRPLSVKMANEIISEFNLNMDIGYLIGRQDHLTEDQRTLETYRTITKKDDDIESLITILLEKLGYVEIAVKGSIVSRNPNLFPLVCYEFFLTQEEVLNITPELRSEMKEYGLVIRYDEHLFSTPYGSLAINADRYMALRQQLKKAILFFIEDAFQTDTIKSAGSEEDSILHIKESKKENLLQYGNYLLQDYNNAFASGPNKEKGYFRQTEDKEEYLKGIKKVNEQLSRFEEQ